MPRSGMHRQYVDINLDCHYITVQIQKLQQQLKNAWGEKAALPLVLEPSASQGKWASQLDLLMTWNLQLR